MKIRKGNFWQYNGYNSALSMPRPRFKPGQGTEITQAREAKLLKKKKKDGKIFPTFYQVVLKNQKRKT